MRASSNRSRHARARPRVGQQVLYLIVTDRGKADAGRPRRRSRPERAVARPGPPRWAPATGLASGRGAGCAAPRRGADNSRTLVYQRACRAGLIFHARWFIKPSLASRHGAGRADRSRRPPPVISLRWADSGLRRGRAIRRAQAGRRAGRRRRGWGRRRPGPWPARGARCRGPGCDRARRGSDRRRQARRGDRRWWSRRRG